MGFPNRRKLRSLVIIGVTVLVTTMLLLSMVFVRVKQDVAERRNRFQIAEDASPNEIAAAVQGLNVGPQVAHWELHLTIETLNDIIKRLDSHPSQSSDVIFQAAFLHTYYQILAFTHEIASADVSCESLSAQLTDLFESRNKLSDQHIEATVLLVDAIDSSQLDPIRAGELIDELEASLEGKLGLNEQREQVANFFAGRKRRQGIVGTEFQIAGTSLDGATVDTRDITAEFVLVEFWSTQCSACIAEAPVLKDIYHRFAPKGFEIVGVSMDPYPGRLIQFVRENSIPWVQIRDRRLANKRMNELGLRKLPTTLMLNRARQVVEVDLRANSVDESRDLERWLEKRLGSE